MANSINGLQVPDFSAPTTSGRIFKLSEHKGKHIVLYFYPKDSTPGCTDESIQFNSLRKDFAGKNCEIYGVSRDSLASHEKFKSKYDFEFELISDTDEKVCEMFDVIKMKNMYGNKVLGIERSTFLIDENGKLQREWRKVKVAGHVEEVLEAIKEL